MLQILKQKYWLESAILILMLAVAVYARTRLPEASAATHMGHQTLH